MSQMANQAGVTEAPGSASYTPGAYSPVDQAGRGWTPARPVVGVGAAMALTVGASIATAIFVRNRARARARQAAWMMLRMAAARQALPLARRTAPFGGGGALLLGALMAARARQAHQ